MLDEDKTTLLAFFRLALGEKETFNKNLDTIINKTIYNEEKNEAATVLINICKAYDGDIN